MVREMFESVYNEIFPFWNGIPDTDKEYICQNSYAVTYPKGKHIHDGSECSGVIFVGKLEALYDVRGGKGHYALPVT